MYIFTLIDFASAMPERLGHTRCLCEECTRNGGVDLDGRPMGVRFSTHAYRSHLARIRNLAQEEAEEEEEVADVLSAREEEERLSGVRGLASAAEIEITDAAARTFAFTVIDEGPDLNNHPSKLWTSRAEFQLASSHSQNIPASSTPIPMEDIIEGINRLTLVPSDPAPSQTPATYSDSPSPVPQSHDQRLPTLILQSHDQRLPTPIPQSHDQRLPTTIPTPLSKKERNRRTTRAMEVLDSIDSTITTALAQLSHSPSKEVLKEAITTLSRLHKAIDGVTRRTPRLDQRKSEVSARLDLLDDRVTVLTAAEGLPKDPVEVSCGEVPLLYLPVTIDLTSLQNIITIRQSTALMK
jgi:hypothetical protein